MLDLLLDALILEKGGRRPRRGRRPRIICHARAAGGAGIFSAARD